MDVAIITGPVFFDKDEDFKADESSLLTLKWNNHKRGFDIIRTLDGEIVIDGKDLPNKKIATARLRELTGG